MEALEELRRLATRLGTMWLDGARINNQPSSVRLRSTTLIEAARVVRINELPAPSLTLRFLSMTHQFAHRMTGNAYRDGEYFCSITSEICNQVSISILLQEYSNRVMLHCILFLWPDDWVLI